MFQDTNALNKDIDAVLNEYLHQTERTQLTFQDWAVFKKEWQSFRKKLLAELLKSHGSDREEVR